MKKLRNIPRILKVNKVEGYHISLLFNNGESRYLNLEYLLRSVLNISKKSPGHSLLDKPDLVKDVVIINTTIGWENIGIEDVDEFDTITFYPYELDPLLLFQHSTPDPDYNLAVGSLIKDARKKAKLTQGQLALKSGTTKQYISRLENNKSDVELLTLKKIVEAGLGKRLQVSFL